MAAWPDSGPSTKPSSPPDLHKHGNPREINHNDSVVTPIIAPVAATRKFDSYRRAGPDFGELANMFRCARSRAVEKLTAWQRVIPSRLPDACPTVGLGTPNDLPDSWMNSWKLWIAVRMCGCSMTGTARRGGAHASME